MEIIKALLYPWVDVMCQMGNVRVHRVIIDFVHM